LITRSQSWIKEIKKYHANFDELDIAVVVMMYFRCYIDEMKL